MTPLPIQKVWLDIPTRDALKEYAWLNRTTVGDVIRTATQDVIDNPGDMSVLSLTDGPSQVQTSVKVNPDTWAKARKAARSVDMSLNSMLRRRLRKLVQDEGLI